MRREWVGVVAVLLLLACGEGCTKLDTVKAAQAMKSYVPAVEELVQAAAGLVESVDVGEAKPVAALCVEIEGGLKQLEMASSAYVAAPSSDGWARVEAVLDGLVNEADQGLMSALEVKNAESQARVRAALVALDAAVHVLDAYRLSTKSASEARGAGEARRVKVEAVARWWSEDDCARVRAAAGM